MVVCPIIIVIIIDYLSSFLDHLGGFMWVLRSPVLGVWMTCQVMESLLKKCIHPPHTSATVQGHSPPIGTVAIVNCFLYVTFSRAARWTPCR